VKINAPELDREIKVRDAYRAMERFLQAHLARGEASTLDLVSYACIAADGVSGDPAALEDFLEALDTVEPEPIRDFQVIIEGDLSTASQAAVEVRVMLADKTERWCYFITPAALANCGDWVQGTRVRMHWGDLHMFVVGECTEQIVRSVLEEVAKGGELLRRTRGVPSGPDAGSNASSVAAA
jgi:hypothetical protein